MSSPDAKRLKKAELEVSRLQKREAKSKSVIADLRTAEKDAKRQLLSQAKLIKRLSEQRERMHMGYEEWVQRHGATQASFDDALQEIGNAWPAGMHEDAPLVLQAWIVPSALPSSPGRNGGGGSGSGSATPAAMSEWIEQYDESSGAVYYYNTSTGETSWEVPLGYGESALDPLSLLGSPAAFDGDNGGFLSGGYGEDGGLLSGGYGSTPRSRGATPSHGGIALVDANGLPASAAFGVEAGSKEGGMTGTQFTMVTMVGLDGQPREMRSAPSTPRRDETNPPPRQRLTDLSLSASKTDLAALASIGDGLPSQPVPPAQKSSESGAGAGAGARPPPPITRQQRFLNLFASATQRVRLLATLNFSSEAIEGEALELALHVTREIRTIQRSSEEEEEAERKERAVARRLAVKAKRKAGREAKRAQQRAELARWSDVQVQRRAARRALVLRQRVADAETVRGEHLTSLRARLAVAKVNTRMHIMLEPSEAQNGGKIRPDDVRMFFVHARMNELNAELRAVRAEAELAVREGRSRAPPLTATEREATLSKSIARSTAYAEERTRLSTERETSSRDSARPSSQARILEPNAVERAWFEWEAVRDDHEAELKQTHSAIKVERNKSISDLLGPLIEGDTSGDVVVTRGSFDLEPSVDPPTDDGDEIDGDGDHDEWDDLEDGKETAGLPPMEDAVESCDAGTLARLMLSLVSLPKEKGELVTTVLQIDDVEEEEDEGEEEGKESSTATKLGSTEAAAPAAAVAVPEVTLIKNAVVEVRHPVSRTLGLCRLRLMSDGTAVYRIRRQDFTFPCVRDADAPRFVRRETGRSADRVFTLSTLTEMVQFRVGTVAELEEWVEVLAKFGWGKALGADPRGDGPGDGSKFAGPHEMVAIRDAGESMLQGWQRLKNPKLDLRPLKETHPVDRIFSTTLGFWVQVRDAILAQQSDANLGITDRVPPFTLTTAKGAKGNGEEKIGAGSTNAQMMAVAIAKLDANTAGAVSAPRALDFMSADERIAHKDATAEHRAVLHWSQSDSLARPGRDAMGPIPSAATRALESRGSARSSAAASIQSDARSERRAALDALRTATPLDGSAQERDTLSSAGTQRSTVSLTTIIALGSDPNAPRRVGIHGDWSSSWERMLTLEIEAPSRELKSEQQAFMKMMEGCSERARVMGDGAMAQRQQWSEQLAMLVAELADDHEELSSAGAADDEGGASLTILEKAEKMSAEELGVVGVAMKNRCIQLTKSIEVADRAMDLLIPHEEWVNDEESLLRNSKRLADEQGASMLSMANDDLALEAVRGARIIEELEAQCMEVEERWARTLSWAGSATANFMERAQRESEAEVELVELQVQRRAIADATERERGRQSAIIVLRRNAVRDLANFVERETVQIRERATFVRSVLASAERRWDAERKACKHELLEVRLTTEETIAEQLHTAHWSAERARQNLASHDSKREGLQSRVAAHNAARLEQDVTDASAAAHADALAAGGDEAAANVAAANAATAAVAEVQRRAGQGADLGSDPLEEMFEWEQTARTLRGIASAAERNVAKYFAEARALSGYDEEVASGYRRWNDVSEMMGWWTHDVVDGAKHVEEEDEESSDSSRSSLEEEDNAAAEANNFDPAAPGDGAGLQIDPDMPVDPTFAGLDGPPSPMSPVSDEEEEEEVEEAWGLLILTNTRESAAAAAAAAAVAASVATSAAASGSSDAGAPRTAALLSFSSVFHGALVAAGAAASSASFVSGPTPINDSTIRHATTRGQKVITAADLKYCEGLLKSIHKWRKRMRREAKHARKIAAHCRLLTKPLTDLWTLGRSSRRVANRFDAERGAIARVELTTIVSEGWEALSSKNERSASFLKTGFEKALQTSRYQHRRSLEQLYALQRAAESSERTHRNEVKVLRESASSSIDFLKGERRREQAEWLVVKDELTERFETTVAMYDAKVAGLTKELADVAEKAEQRRMWLATLQKQTREQQQAAETFAKQVEVSERRNADTISKLTADLKRVQEESVRRMNWILALQGRVKQFQDELDVLRGELQTQASKFHCELRVLHHERRKRDGTMVHLLTHADDLILFTTEALATTIAGTCHAQNVQLGSNCGVPILTALCRSPRPLVRRLAARALGRSVWDGSADPRVRIYAARNLWMRWVERIGPMAGAKEQRTHAEVATLKALDDANAADEATSLMVEDEKDIMAEAAKLDVAMTSIVSRRQRAAEKAGEEVKKEGINELNAARLATSLDSLDVLVQLCSDTDLTGEATGEEKLLELELQQLLHAPDDSNRLITAATLDDPLKSDLNQSAVEKAGTLVSKGRGLKIARKVVRELRRRCVVAFDVFRWMDPERRGTLTRHQFTRGLERLGFELPAESSISLFTFLDVDGNDVLNFDSFQRIYALHSIAQAPSRAISEVMAKQAADARKTGRLSTQREELLTCATDAIAVLALSDANKRRLGSMDDCIPAMVRLCALPSSDVQRNCAAALGNLAFNDGQNKKLVAKCGGVEALVLLVRTSEDLDVLENATTALAVLSFENEDNTKRMGACDAIPPLYTLCVGVRAAESENVQAAAVEAMANLTSTSMGMSERHAHQLHRLGVDPLVALCGSANVRLQVNIYFSHQYSYHLTLLCDRISIFHCVEYSVFE